MYIFWLAALHVRIYFGFRGRGGHFWWRFVFACFNLQKKLKKKTLKFNDIKKKKKKKKIFYCTYFLQFTKSPHFPLRGKVGHGQITEISKRKRERALLVDIYIISL